jgi:fluoride exporter
VLFKSLICLVNCAWKIKLSNILLVFVGSGLGGLFRYWISNEVHLLLSRSFPYGTLIVNVTGCFLMGLLFTLILDRFSEVSTQLRAFLLIGFLGGYTTFSSFSIETISLIEGGNLLSATLNIFISILSCISAAWIGVILGRQL